MSDKHSSGLLGKVMEAEVKGLNEKIAQTSACNSSGLNELDSGRERLCWKITRRALVARLGNMMVMDAKGGDLVKEYSRQATSARLGWMRWQKKTKKRAMYQKKTKKLCIPLIQISEHHRQALGDLSGLR